MPRTTKSISNNYLVRIYRRKHKDSRLLVGVAEKIGGTMKQAFSNIDELWEILNETDDKQTGNRKERGGEGWKSD